MFERSELDYIFDIVVSKEEYCCLISNRDTDERLQIFEKELIRFAQRVCRPIFLNEFFYTGRCYMEMKFMRERIRTCIRKKLDWEYFYLMNDVGDPSRIGIFITWEEEETEA